MSLTSALYTASTGLTVNRAALEVTGNNLANAATEGYTRQRVNIAASRGTEVRPGVFIGTGVRLEGVNRVVDEALNARLRTAVSDRSATEAHAEVLTQIEAIEGALSDSGVSSRLTEFLNNFSELANDPADPGLRSLTIAEGGSFAQYLNGLNRDLGTLREQVEGQIAAGVRTTEGLLDQVAMLNRQIVSTEGGAGGANALRDERDQLLKELSTYLDINTVEQASGTVDVLVDSTPIVLAGENRGLTLERKTVDGGVELQLRVEADGTRLEPDNGRLGQLMRSRTEDVRTASEALDTFTHQLIFQVNKLHSSGQAAEGFTELTGTTRTADPAAALSSPEAALPFEVRNGSFQLHVTQQSTGARTTKQIDVDLDGIGTDTSLSDLATQIEGADNVSASVGPDGRLSITADTADFRFSFSDDSSDALAALGINTFFSGKGPGDIAANDVLRQDPAKLAVGRGHVSGDNRTALAIADLGERPVEPLGGESLQGFWRGHVEEFAIRTDQANQALRSDTIIAENLENQRQSISGVSIDQEAINMLTYQRAYQASARVITVVDELMQTTLGLIR